MFQTDWAHLRESPVNIMEIEKKVRKFYITLNLESDEEVLLRMYEARNLLDSARMLVRSMIKIEENRYIQKYKQQYLWMVDNLGRTDKKLDEAQQNIAIKSIGAERINPGQPIPYTPSILEFIREIKILMEHLVYYPLKNALIKYNHIDEYHESSDELIKKDKMLFEYLLFLELLHASTSLGSITAEKVRSTKTGLGESTTERMYSDEFGMPYVPDEVETIKKPLGQHQSKEVEERALDFFMGGGSRAVDISEEELNDMEWELEDGDS